MRPEDDYPATSPVEAVAESETGEGPGLVDGVDELHRRWHDAQSAFVDDPRRAVQEARELVEDVLDRLRSTFDEERERLEGEWSAGREPSTEDLRQALQRYRTFFDRLLSV
ncbi:hypothetical protein [Phytoactinopolyspora halotolerans]|uniref:Uncharacterized protein n=1 Tax=Phytoactinopolyspora halotolerans TaxID=1981512 RepID=A0A6L9SA73_9ACTN|nr:hypothetical protein [Phytoactinopolyspora halotolerans]NEE02007.1 hypothetical protein [Phytoactinopolyspora halotolerans]